MDTPVNTFKVSDVSPTEAIDQLLKLPEVESAFQLRGLRRSSSPVASATRRNEARNSNTEKKISLDLSGVTVRQVLHRIAAESDTKFWIFRRHPGGTFSLGTSAINWP
jgi:hypothetical protein